MGQPARKLSSPPPPPAKKAKKAKLVKPAANARPKIEKAANGPAPKTTAKKKATKKKVVKKVVKKKVVKKAAPKPVAKKAAPKPVAKQAAPKPVAKKAAPKPVAKKAAPAPAQPVVESKAATPEPGVPEPIQRGATTPIDGASSLGVVSDSDTMSMAPLALEDLDDVEDLSESAELSVVEGLGGGFAAAESSANIEPAANAAPPAPPRRFHKAFAGAMLSAAALIGWGLLGGDDEAEPEVAAAVPTAFDLVEEKSKEPDVPAEDAQVEDPDQLEVAPAEEADGAEEKAPAKSSKRRGKRKSTKGKSSPKAPAASKKEPRKKGSNWRDPDAGKPIPPGTKMVNASEKKLQQTIRQGMYHVHRCYDSELRRNPGLQGRMEITVYIGVTGKVYRVAIHKNTVDSAKVKECVRAKIKRWRFDFGGRLRQSTQVSFPISFKP